MTETLRADSALQPGRQTAAAKVNLSLHVTGKRADGYHLLDSLVVFGPAADVLELALPQPAEEAQGLCLGLRLGGPFGQALQAEPDNLVLRAARALAGAAGIPARAQMLLHKHLPVASGIGGGSADAAAALHGLNALWGLNWDAARLQPLALALGADIPVCLAGKAARMQGVGEVLVPAPRLPSAGMLLVNPGQALATPAVFRARTGGFRPAAAFPAQWPDAATMAADLRANTANDLEAAACALCPPIAEVLAAIAALPGCLLARMSGSGATCFGLFADAAAAERAAAALPVRWWHAAGSMRG